MGKVLFEESIDALWLFGVLLILCGARLVDLENFKTTRKPGTLPRKLRLDKIL